MAAFLFSLIYNTGKQPHDRSLGHVRIPEQVGHQFRSNPATDSVSFRPGIPVESGH
jgi:hypothetical protein